MKLWDDRTELEKALLLVLCVTIPVNAILIYFYFYLMTYYPKVTVVSEAIVKKEISKEEIFKDRESEQRTGSTSTIAPKMFIGSLSEGDEDSPDKYKYHCSAVLLSRSYFLASNEKCLESENLNMRISSDYWFKGGFTSKVLRVLEPVKSKLDSKFYHIGKLLQPFLNETFVKTVAYPTREDKYKMIKFDSYIWNSTYTDDEGHAKIYNRMIRVHLTTTECSQHHNGFCTMESNNDYDLAFKSGTEILIGIKFFNTENEQYYGYLGQADVKKMKNITN